MQLTSMPPASISGSGPVIRSATPPGTMGGGAPSASSAPDSSTTRPASSAEGASAPNESSVTPRPPTPASSASETGSEPSNGRGGESPASIRGGEQARESGTSERQREESQGRGDTEGSPDTDEASPERQTEVNELRSRDREVRQHEQAHQVVGGQYAGAPTYDYTRGPDGQLYATGGQVSIDTSPIPDDPQATINKMQVVRAAALAPAEPSPQDIQAAQEATSTMLAARAELQAERREETADVGDSSDGNSNPASDGSDSPDGEDADPRIALFRDVDGFSDSPPEQEARPRFEAIA